MGTLRVTVLGCGSSGGVPRATGEWGVCDPKEPKNTRTRCGLLLQQWSGARARPEEATTVLIDTPPELREQLAKAGPSHLDAILISHDHADQTNGFDDVRTFFIKQRAQLPVWTDAHTRTTFMRRFGYCFESGPGYPAIARDAGHIESLVPISVSGPGGVMEVLPLAQDHGFSPSLGFRVGPVAYSNDLVSMPRESFAALDGLKLWIVDALRDKPHPTHAHVERALEWIADVRPAHALLTNMHIDMDYATLKESLPNGVQPGYDGWSGDYNA
jgi:phosphoribosyl 1,2-cyclic phosphate phosphodiesterase